MKRLSNLIGRSPAIAISLTALALSLGGGATEATVIGPSNSITWHNLHLIHGWAPGQASSHAGNPRYAISNGVVYLSGGVQQSSGSSAVFAVLPRAARPRHSLYISVLVAYGNTVGVLYVNTLGQLWAYSTDPTKAREFTSLAAVSFALGS